MSPDATAFAHLVDDGGFPRAVQRFLRGWRASSSRDVELPIEGAVTRVLHSADGHWLASAGGSTARVWDATTGRCLLTLAGHRTLVRAAAFSGDGRRIVTGSVDQTSIVWDTISGKLLLRLQGHASTVFSVSFSPDGQRILTSSADHTARVWDASTGDLLLTLRGHSDRLFSAAFSPDGQRIVTGGGDNLARIWETASKEQVANWQKVELTATE